MIKKFNERKMNESYGVYDLINYFDVWGNAEDGWDVNDVSRDETDIWIDDDSTDEEIVDYLIDEVGFLSPDARGKVEVWNDGDMIEFSVAETGEPLGRLERKRTVSGKSMGESRKRRLRKSVTRESIKKRAKLSGKAVRKRVCEDIDDDTDRFEYKMQLLELIDMLDDLKTRISDMDFDVTSARNIDDDKFYYGYDNCKQSIDNAETYLSYIRNSLK